MSQANPRISAANRRAWRAPNSPQGYAADKLSAALSPLKTVGQPRLLERSELLGLLCSSRCPGTLVLHSYDLARSLRNAEMPIISGFHSPMEKECLDLLLRGTQPVIVCLARGLQGMRIPAPWRQAIDAGRMLLVSQFPDGIRRVTATTAQQRNQLVADLATAIMVIHAAPNSHTLALCERALAAGKPVFALDSPHNNVLAALGVQMVLPNDVSALEKTLDR